MKHGKQILIGALCGAVLGALAVRLDGASTLSSLPAPLRPDKSVIRWQFVAAALGWVAFSFYWENAAKKAAVDRSAEAAASRGVHVFLANAALMLILAPIRGLGRFAPANSVIMSAGVAVVAIGLFLAIWARRHLGQNWSGRISIKVDHQLIRSGPYGLLRHPIYTGILAMYLGCTLVTGEWLAVIGMAVAVFAYWRKMRLEEANLDLAFGADYQEYCRETWALLPWII